MLEKIANSSMNREIELHDAEVAAVDHIEGSTSILFSTVDVHESAGVPGFDPGLLWTQSAIVTIKGASPLHCLVELPIWVLSGNIRAGETVYKGFIPAEGRFDGDVELLMTLSTQDGSDGGQLEIKGTGIKIELLGDPSEAVVFNECPRRSIE